jgi:hypothetical protein
MHAFLPPYGLGLSERKKDLHLLGLFRKERARRTQRKQVSNIVLEGEYLHAPWATFLCFATHKKSMDAYNRRG